jgi:hypothetical protein
MRQGTHRFPPLRGLREGEVSASYADGGVKDDGDSAAMTPPPS